MSKGKIQTFQTFASQKLLRFPTDPWKTETDWNT